MRKRRGVAELEVVHFPNAGEVIKPDKKKIDLWAVREVRSGLIVRWLQSEKEANKVVERVRAGGKV
jgi:hypothetical protein